MSTQERFSFPLLDLTRAGLAMWVLFCHITLMMGYRVFLIGQGGVAVDVFIIVSGLLMYLIISGEKTLSWLSVKQFYVRRFFRVAPVFYFALVIHIILRKFYYTGLTDMETLFKSPFIVSQFASGDVYWYDILANIFFVHGLDPWAAGKVLGPAWSLSLEAQFYLVAPFLLFYFVRKPWLVLGITFVLGVINNLFIGVYDVAATWIPVEHYIFPSFLGCRLFLFMLGATCCRCLIKLDRNNVLMILAASVGCLYLFRMKSMIFCVPVVLFFVFAKGFPKLFFIKWLNWISQTKPIVLLAEYSYSIYLMHMFWLVIAIKFLKQYFPQDGNYGVNEAIWFTLLSTVLSIVMAIPVFHFIEQPTREWGKVLAKKMGKKKPAAAGPEPLPNPQG